MNAVMSTNVLQFHAPIESHLMKIYENMKIKPDPLVTFLRYCALQALFSWS